MTGKPDPSEDRRGHRARLRARYEQGGLEAFLPYEVLEMALTWAVCRRDVKPLAKALLARFGTVHDVLRARDEDLREIDGVGERTSLFLRFLGDLLGHCLAEKAAGASVLGTPESVADYLRLTIGAGREERFQVLFLDAQNRALASEVLQTGTVDQAVVYPRKVIERALARNAVALILVHNHPSGHLSPSPQDVSLTTRIVRAAEAVDLRVHDHLIVSREGYYSFREAGLLSAPSRQGSRAANR